MRARGGGGQVDIHRRKERHLEQRCGARDGMGLMGKTGASQRHPRKSYGGWWESLMERRGSEKEVNEKEDKGWSGQFPVVVRMPLSGQPLRNHAQVLPDGETAPSRGSFSYWC